MFENAPPLDVPRVTLLAAALASFAAACGSSASEASRAETDASTHASDAAPGLDALPSLDADLDAAEVADADAATPCPWSTSGTNVWRGGSGSVRVRRGAA